jgi:nucleotide-binding universal stress UspA family protein
MYKDIVVQLGAGLQRDVAGEFAISVASELESHLSGVAFSYEPPISGGMLDGVTPAVIDRWREERQAEAERARKAFDEMARKAGIVFDSRVLSDDTADAAYVFSAVARNYDLSVVAQAQPDLGVAESLTIEAALFDSGRPVLVVPYIQEAGLKLDRVVVCWDGSRNAARAVGDAMPLLARAGRIDVVTIETKESRSEFKGAQIAEHLARHKLKVDLKPIVAPDTDVANVILSFVADNSGDLIVMGAYGHTRIREFVLGGTTRGILESMTVPALMAH